MSNRLTYSIAAILLLTMALLAIFSIKEDTFTFDETAHITAGYSYLVKKDMRLNPEHPPLIKDIAALPLLFLNLKFPSNHPAWVQKEPPKWWFQFDVGSQFLYSSGNNPDQILFYSRIPMILILIFMGWFLFFWSKKIFGNKGALLTLFLFSLSPTFLAHGRLVTTDAAASLGAVLATYFWIKFLKEPSKKNIILAGLIFGLSMLFKFSLVLIIPFFITITLVYAWIKVRNVKKYWFSALKYLALSFLVGVIGMIFVVWPIYQYHVWNYPLQKQVRDTEFLLSSLRNRPLAELVTKMAKNPILRPYAQFFLGIIMVSQRVSGGNTMYFLGEISSKGWRNYFPVVYSIKEPLPFHILTITALLYLAWLIKKPFWKKPLKRSWVWIDNHFTEFSMLVFIGIYWAVSINSNLNLGIRHLLPVFPFTMILTAGVISKFLKQPFLKLKCLFLGILIFWQIFSVVKIYPHFIAYFNELIDGPNNGYIYTVDSNLDWGQDLKRLKNWMDENKIDNIYLDYFGGGNANYYLKNKYISWNGNLKEEKFPRGNYLAISASSLQGGRGLPAHNFDQPWGYYLWLDKYKPIKKIGYSIFVYYIK